LGGLVECLYLDASPVIYLVEEIPPFADAVRARLADPNVIQVVSDLTRMECRVMPIRNHTTGLLHEFNLYFQRSVAEIVPLTGQIMDRAAEIRAQFRFKTPDAIHLAAAVVSGCDAFLTNDHRLDRFTGIKVEVLQP
jgi:uncharacterized protein